MAHSRFAPSSAKRRMDCPASLLAEQGEPDRESYDAIWGSCAHFLAEHCLRNGTPADLYLDEPILYFNHNASFLADGDIVPEGAVVIRVDDEMADCCQDYIDWCLELPGDVFIETRTDISPWCPELDEHGNPLEPQSGTADHAACLPGVLTVTDLKGGKGVQVFAHRNPQLALYALGFLHMWDWLYDFEKIVIRVCQPRLGHHDVWEVSKAELLAFGEEIKRAHERCLEPNPEFNPTEDACRFCKVAHKCKALAAKLESERALAFDDLTGGFVEPIEFLTPEQIVSAYKLRGLLDRRMKAIEHAIMSSLVAKTGEFPMLKLVENPRVRRRWADRNEMAVARQLLEIGVPKEKIFTRKLVSPAKAENTVKGEARKKISELAFKPPGKPMIVPASDPRPEYAVSNALDVQTIFDDLDAED